MAGVHSVFDEQGNTELFVNYMDTKRCSDPDYFAQLHDLYAKKYQHHHFDAIVCSDDHALNFLLTYRDALFPGTPVVFCGINDFHPNRIAGHAQFTGVYETYDVAGTIELMSSLHPDTRKIAVVTDDTYSGKDFRALTERAEALFANHLTFEYLHNLAPDALSAALGALSEDTLVLWAVYLRTPQGKSISCEDSVRLITRSSKRPTYCIWDVVGQGVAGGKITDPHYQGQAAAEMASAILRGTKVSDLPVQGSPLVYKFDMDAMRRYGIALSDLPPESIVLNKPFSPYQEYKAVIWATLGWVIFQMVVILGLAYTIRQLKLARQREAQLQEKLADAERRNSLGVLAGGVAHDLNNILGPIVMLPELIDETLAGPGGTTPETLAEVREDLKMIVQSAKRAAAVVQDLQALGRRGHVALQPLEANHLVRDCLSTQAMAMLRNEYPQVRISEALHATPLNINADKTDIHRVLDNLILNAIEAIDDQGEVQLATEPVVLSKQKLGYEAIAAGSYVVIHVRNTGERIPDSILKRMFEPFVTTKKISGGKSGSGLGLSVVHAVMKDFKGYIDVRTNVGMWATTFSLYLPSTSATPTQEPLAVHSAASLPRGSEHILVVDDEPNQRFGVRRSLESLGYTVSEAAHGHEAVAMVQQALSQSKPPYDMILLDMIMEEGFDGLDTLQAIRALLSEQKIVVISGHAESARADAARELGADWLPKPYQLRDLATTVREKLDAPGS